MRRISRITVAYDARQDRLRLAMLDMDNHAIVLWLTQRLADRLVSRLIETLDETVERDMPEATKAGAKPAAQYLQQTEADLRMTRTAPVEALAGVSVEKLIERIGVKRSTTALTLEFYWDEDSAVLPMDMVYLRQLLRIVYRHYKKGGWLKDGVFPAWFADNANQTLVAASQVN